MDENQLKDIPQDLLATIKLIYTPINLEYTKLIKEIESEEYNAPRNLDHTNREI